MYYAEQSGEGNTGEDEEMVHFSRIYSECLNRMMLGEAEGKEGLDQLLTEVLQLPEDRRPVLYRVLYNRTAERLVALQLETGQMEEVPSPQSVTGENSGEALRQLFARSSRILKDSGKKEQYRFVESAREYIHAHYADSMLSLDVVSGHLGISSPYLSGLMSRYLSMGFVEYISRYRLEQAKRLMEISDISIQEIGRKTGFNSPQSFGRVFKKYNGETPGRYREKVLRKKDGEGGEAGK